MVAIQLPNILARCAPEVWQQSSCPHREGREDLRPALVPCSPEVRCSPYSIMLPCAHSPYRMRAAAPV